MPKNDLSSQAGKDKATCLHRLLPDATLRTLRRYEHHQSVAKCVRWQQCGSSAQACRPHSVRKEGSRLLARPVASELIHSIAHGGRAQAELLCHTTAAESRVRGAVQRAHAVRYYYNSMQRMIPDSEDLHRTIVNN